jgi:hypothetical protein
MRALGIGDPQGDLAKSGSSTAADADSRLLVSHIQKTPERPAGLA